MRASVLLGIAVVLDVLAAVMLWFAGPHAFAAFMALVAVTGAILAVVLWTRGR